MITAYYIALLIISAAMLGVYFVMWHNHYDLTLSLIFVLIPIVDIGYVSLCLSEGLEAALLSNNIIYLGGCYLSLLMMITILGLCKIRPGKVFFFITFMLSTIVFCSALTSGRLGIFYRDVSFDKINGVGYLTDKVYGPMHTVFVVMTIVYTLIPLCAIIYSFINRKDISNRSLILLFINEILSVAGYFVAKVVTIPIDFVPLTYFIAQVCMLLVVRRIYMYNVIDSGIDSIESKGEIGFISFDMKLRYLGSNELSKKIFPELSDLQVDRSVPENSILFEEILKRLRAFENDDKKNSFIKRTDNGIYKIDINHLYSLHRKCGFQLLITDDTKNQEYITLIRTFNDKLRQQVEEKTQHIVEMHDNLIISMATVVESRDNSTGGHIKRTSDLVRILTDEIRKDNKLGLTDAFIKDLVKAAPMHDLGKIGVDDDVLKKPGKFTPKEFELMKEHAPKGGQIVHEILKNTDDREFAVIAENVAHYHHERMDGSGYPDGLKGDQIPIEARIMAIADVYDALVSKRVYKDRMSFEKADSIMMESFGKHFDPQLQQYYISSRPVFEKYYLESSADD